MSTVINNYAGWHVTLCDLIWHVSSHSSEACCKLLYRVTCCCYAAAIHSPACAMHAATARPTIRPSKVQDWAILHYMIMCACDGYRQHVVRKLWVSAVESGKSLLASQ